MNNGTFWAVSCLYMPSNSALRMKTFYRYRAMLQSAGVPLCVVELASTPEHFKLTTDDADLVIQLTGETQIWQKEALLNFAIEALPESCTEVGIFDVDILIDDPNWVTILRKALQKSSAVQVFSHLVFLPKNATNLNRNTLSNYIKKKQFQLSITYLETYYPFAIGIHGLPGGAWAFDRSFIQEIRLFDQAICGGGDAILAAALLGRDIPGNYMEEFPAPILYQAILWAEKVRAFDVQPLCCNLIAAHLYHGSMSSRKYGERYKKSFWKKYDPNKDIIRDEHGLLAFKDPSGNLARGIRHYYYGRSNAKIPTLLNTKPFQFCQRILNRGYFEIQERYAARTIYSILWYLDKTILTCGRWYIKSHGQKTLSGLSYVKEDLEQAGGTLLTIPPEDTSTGRSLYCFRGRGKDFISLLEEESLDTSITDILIAEVPIFDTYSVMRSLKQKKFVAIDNSFIKAGKSIIGAAKSKVDSNSGISEF